MKKSILINDVTKRFGETVALNRINLNIEAGRVYGLLGRNGAGKSTLLNAICNRIKISEGSISVSGKDIIDNNETQSHLFLMSESSYYPDMMKVKDVISYTNAYYPNFDENYAFGLAKEFGLDIAKKVFTLSTGYTSILKLILALSVNVDFVFLDEPVLGLDANHRHLFYQKLIGRIDNGKSSFIISTHLIDEVASIIQEVIVIDRGMIKLAESADDLLANAYSVSGRRDKVEDYCLNKKVIGSENMGELKVAHIIGKRERVSGLEYTPLKLQEIFIELTSGGIAS